MFPSLCELAGIDAPNYMQGTSFVPLMENPNKPWKSAAFSQFHRCPKISPDGGRYMGYSMKTKTHHYVEWYEWDSEKGERGNLVTKELYDNENDPHETVNIAGEATQASFISELLGRLKAGWKAAIPKE